MSLKISGKLALRNKMVVTIYDGEKVVDVRSANGIKVFDVIHLNGPDGKPSYYPFDGTVFTAPKDGEPIPTYSLQYDPRRDPDYVLPDFVRDMLPAGHSGSLVSARAMKKSRFADKMNAIRETCGSKQNHKQKQNQKKVEKK